MPRRKDDLTNPISAVFGDRVLVEPHGNNKFIVTKLKPRRRKKSSKAQKIGQERFQEAVVYAGHVLKDPKRKAAYARKLKGKRNVYQAALSAYMRSNDGEGLI